LITVMGMTGFDITCNQAINSTFIADKCFIK
jgi:hypothetical protein